MTGIQFVTDGRGRKVAVLIDLKKHGARLEDFWDGLISESRRREAGVPLGKVKAGLVQTGRPPEKLFRPAKTLPAEGTLICSPPPADTSVAPATVARR